MRTRIPLYVVVAAWFGAIVLCMGWFARYELTPGAPAVSAPVLSSAALRLGRGQKRLVIFVHPQCPCSRATIGELAPLLERFQGRLTARVEFYKPDRYPDGWEKTDLWRSAAAIPGVTVTTDRAGADARRFGSATSGQTLLYDETGHLLFSGGITAARGQAGENDGSRAIAAIMEGGSGPTSTPVFGCSLVAPSENGRR